MIRATAQSLDKEVHIWRVELRASPLFIEGTFALLSRDERERAAKYRRRELRDCFVLSRGVLRRLLSNYLGCPPDRVELVYGEQGKPAVASPSSRIRFNVSHSGKLAVYALAYDCDLGVDIEHVRPVPDADQLSKRFFSPEECEDIIKLLGMARAAAFLRCWVRKEAYIKAVGSGMSIPLESFRVSALPGHLAILPPPGETRDWRLRDLCVGPEYIGAIAFPAPDRALSMLPLITAGADFTDGTLALAQAEEALQGALWPANP